MASCVKQKIAKSDEDGAHTDQLFKFVFYQDWRLSTRFATWNQQNVTRMFQEHLHILGMIDLATVARIIHLVGGRSIRIAE